GDVDRVRRQGTRAECHGRVDGDAVVELCGGAERIDGGDGEGFRSRGRGGREGGVWVGTTAGQGQTGDGVLDVADDQALVARAAGSRDGLVVGNIDRVGRQGARAECHGRIDRDAVVGLRRVAGLVGGCQGEGFRPRGR